MYQCGVTAASFIIATLALVVSLASASFAHRAAKAAETQSEAAKAEDRRARTPHLTVSLDAQVNDGETRAFYTLRNDGKEDLDSVLVRRPETPDGVRYPVSLMGGDFGDTAELGPLVMGRAAVLVLAIGPAEQLPEFRVRVVCRKGQDSWESSILLDDPRFRINVY